MGWGNVGRGAYIPVKLVAIRSLCSHFCRVLGQAVDSCSEIAVLMCFVPYLVARRMIADAIWKSCALYFRKELLRIID